MKPIAEACLRNQSPIADVLETLLCDAKHLLEIASGTGQHAVYVGQRLNHLKWQTSDLPICIDGINQWVQEAKLDNVLSPIALDVCDSAWPVAEQYDAIFAANIVHFVAWEVVESMLAGIQRHLALNGTCIFYGPYNLDGQFTSEGNANLDRWLKNRDAESGIKDIASFIKLAEKHQLSFVNQITMPANNWLLHFERRSK